MINAAMKEPQKEGRNQMMLQNQRKMNVLAELDGMKKVDYAL